MLTTFNEIDMSAAIALRERYRDAFEKKHGVRLGFMSIFVKAAIVALKELPGVNAEIDGDDIVYKNHYDIGVAVGTEQGLVVPVVRDADRMSFAEIEKAIAALGRKARDGKLTIEDLSGGTFTISNGGDLRLADVDADPQPAAIRHPRHAQDRAAARRAMRRQDRDPADDVCRALLRPPHRRRPRGGDLPRADQGVRRRPLAHPVRHVRATRLRPGALPGRRRYARPAAGSSARYPRRQRADMAIADMAAAVHDIGLGHAVDPKIDRGGPVAIDADMAKGLPRRSRNRRESSGLSL